MRKLLSIAFLLILGICTSIRADHASMAHLPSVSKSQDGWIEFVTGWDSRKIRANVTGETYIYELTGYWGEKYYPQYNYLVIFADIAPCGTEETYISAVDSFWIKDRYGAIIPMADLDPQFAAALKYGTTAIYDPIIPGTMYHMVFVFDVQLGPHELMYRPWTN